MSFFWVLLAGGMIFALWRKVEALQRDLWEISGQLQVLRDQHRQAEPDRSQDDAVPMPAQRIAEPEPETTQPADLPASPAEPTIEPAPASEPEAEPVPEAELAYSHAEPSLSARIKPPRFSFDFEDIFGRRLPIWGGGIALAIAGIFLVRYSIEQGLVTPLVRVIMSFLFGFGLLAGAEAAFRFEDRVKDPRVRQALAGAGLATLFGAFYLAGTQYGLIGAGSAFIGLAAVTAGAIALSFRFGLPCAILGLVGGFAAPMLVESSNPNVPLLALYLALVTGGLAYAGRAQQRPWLGYAALAGGLLWGFLLLFAGTGWTSEILAVGGYLVVIGTVLPAFLHADKGPSIPRLLAGGMATIQMAGLIGTAGDSLLTWGLYLLLGAALAFFGWRDVRLRVGCSIAAGIALVLLVFWTDPGTGDFTLVATGIAAIFAAVPLAQVWRGHARLAELAQLALVPLALGAIAYLHYGSWKDNAETGLALGFVALAALPAIGAWLEWRGSDRGDSDTGLAGLIASAAMLAWWAMLAVTDGWSTPLGTAALALAVWELARRRGSMAITVLAWMGAGLTVLSLIATGGFFDELEQLGSDTSTVALTRALPRWLAAALPFLALAWSGKSAPARHVAEGFAAILLYGLAAQILPADALAWAAALAALALGWFAPERAGGWAAWLGIALIWAVEPLGEWYFTGLMSLIGEPVLAKDVVVPRDVLLQLAPFMLGSLALGWRIGITRPPLRVPAFIAGGLVAIVALHSLWKLVFHIDGMPRFELLGMGERSVWEALLLGGAFALFHVAKDRSLRLAGWGLLAASLLHFGWYTLFLHNPLWDWQRVGPAPIANWLLLAYGTACAALVLARRQMADAWTQIKPVIDILLMALISLFALSGLRHGFAGSLMADDSLGPTEDLLRSVLAIALAIGFLLWGARMQSRTWRIGSLVLMLLAVFKVFLIDTAGLEGLLRIASFMALGFSLIGIGWFYSRQLSGPKEPATDQ
ncbi:MAG: DUF2339 domain-containing protein [Sphingomonadaceae bacterium]|nr:DUF2339 domain-containing protein [Sphingomonadaceae bacterium]